MEQGDRGPAGVQRAGAEVGVVGTLSEEAAAGVPSSPRSTARSRGKGGGAELDPSPGVRTRARSKPRG